MKFRGLIIAVVVLLVLGGLLYWSSHRKPSLEIPDTRASAAPSILSLDRGAITGLTLTGKDSAPGALKKSNSDQWQITAPKAWNADQDAVSGVLSTLSSLNADRVVEDKTQDLKQYGLDEPAETIVVTEKNGKEHKLLLGDGTPAGGDVYAMLAGDPRVFTIAGYNKTSIDKGLNDLRDKRLVTIEPDKLSRVELAKKAGNIEFARIKDGWQILKPQPMRADGFAVDELVRAVTDARMVLGGAEGSDAAAKFAQGSPVATVTLTGDRGAQTLELHKDKDDYYAKSTAVEGDYKVDSSLGLALDKSLDDFRNKKLFDLGYEEPGKIELRSGAKSWFFTRSGSDWWSNGKKMDGDAVESLVEKLRDLSATGFPGSGFSSPDVEATVTSNDGKQVERIAIAKSGENYIAKRENEPALYQLDASAVDGLTAAADAVRPAATPAK